MSREYDKERRRMVVLMLQFPVTSGNLILIKMWLLWVMEHTGIYFLTVKSFYGRLSIVSF